jgi:8-amino-7-oxononanoate synthase
MTDRSGPGHALDAELERELTELASAGLLRTLREVGPRLGPHLTVDGRPVVDFSSNDYLGLASDARVRQALVEALRQDGAGATASRSLGGNHQAHEALERDAARRKGTEAALLFPSGYAANVGALPALAGEGDALYSDALNHASIIDGCRLARAEVRIFAHNDLDALEARLRADQGRFRRRVIVVEGVYSMDGDLSPLPDLVAMAAQYGAAIYLDDAHATGVLGPAGGGSGDHWQVAAPATATVGTLGKAFGTAGAFVAGSPLLRQLLLNRARSFVFTTGPSPALARAALAAMAISDREPWRRDRLRANARLLTDGLAATGVAISPRLAGHIVPVQVRDPDRAVRLGRALWSRGFLVGAIRPPTVPADSARLRITVSAAHEPEDVHRLVEALALSLREGG